MYLTSRPACRWSSTVYGTASHRVYKVLSSRYPKATSWLEQRAYPTTKSQHVLRRPQRLPFYKAE
jgi:hypothetical protein